jgi:hypothetical protein
MCRNPSDKGLAASAALTRSALVGVTLLLACAAPSLAEEYPSRLIHAIWASRLGLISTSSPEPAISGAATKTPRPSNEAPVIIGRDDGTRSQRGDMPCTPPANLGRCVLRLDSRNRHMTDGIGARDLGEGLAPIQPRQNFTLLMLGQLRRPSHVDTRRLGAADAVAGAGADQLALELAACRTAAVDRYLA